MPVKFLPSPSGNQNYQLAVEVLKAQFPDYVASSNVVVHPDTKTLPRDVTGQYTKGSSEGYGPGIELGMLAQKFTTPGVMDAVQTLMHEITHARKDTAQAQQNQKTGMFDLGDGRLGNEKYLQTDKFRQIVMEFAMRTALPSSDSPTNALEEFLANAQPALDLQNKKIPSEYQKKINTILSDPLVATWVSRNKYPELPTLQPLAQTTSSGFAGTMDFAGIPVSESDVSRLNNNPVLQELRKQQAFHK